MAALRWRAAFPRRAAAPGRGTRVRARLRGRRPRGRRRRGGRAGPGRRGRRRTSRTAPRPPRACAAPSAPARSSCAEPPPTHPIRGPDQRPADAPLLHERFVLRARVSRHKLRITSAARSAMPQTWDGSHACDVTILTPPASLFELNSACPSRREQGTTDSPTPAGAANPSDSKHPYGFRPFWPSQLHAVAQTNGAKRQALSACDNSSQSPQSKSRHMLYREWAVLIAEGRQQGL